MNNERYLDPPDEPEADYCEDCGQEMEYESPMTANQIEFICTNPFCPAKFEKYKGGTISVVLDMAQKLVEVSEDLRSSTDSLEFVRNNLSWLQLRLTQKEDEIASLERQIIEYQRILTLGQ